MFTDCSGTGSENRPAPALAQWAREPLSDRGAAP